MSKTGELYIVRENNPINLTHRDARKLCQCVRMLKYPNQIRHKQVS